MARGDWGQHDWGQPERVAERRDDLQELEAFLEAEDVITLAAEAVFHVMTGGGTLGEALALIGVAGAKADRLALAKEWSFLSWRRAA